jgi:hypothetical protein
VWILRSWHSGRMVADEPRTCRTRPWYAFLISTAVAVDLTPMIAYKSEGGQASTLLTASRIAGVARDAMLLLRSSSVSCESTQLNDHNAMIVYLHVWWESAE